MSAPDTKDSAGILEKGGETLQVSSSSAPKRPWWTLGGKDVSFAAVDSDSVTTGSSGPLKEVLLDTPSDSDEHNNNVFHDSAAAQFYQPVEKYEGRHRFDPHATWSAEEEQKLIRTLDRGNITQALSDNMLTELPSQLVSKKIGPDNWIPIQMLLWSVVAISQFKITGRATFFITRFLLGLLEGGFIPDVILYLSYFYRNRELPVRLAWFWTSYVSTNIVSAFLAYGILHLRGRHGLGGWRWLFLIEGSLTGLLGILSWFYLPPSPTQTKRTGLKGALRPKDGWFSEREETIMVTRILRDDPGKATMHNVANLPHRFNVDNSNVPFTYHLIKPKTPPANYLTLTLKALGFSTFNTNLLTIPSSVLFILQLQFWTWLSEKLNQRFLIGLVSQLWAIPLLIALETLPPNFAHANWVRFAVSSLIVGYPYVHAILVAITSRNAGTVRTRTVGSSLYNMAVQTSNIISTQARPPILSGVFTDRQQIYQNNDKPLYYTGNKVLLGLAAYNVILFIGAKAFYIWKNNQRDEIWDSKTREEKLDYLATTKDKGNKRLDFRFAS
ncbi:hypothetical protein G7Y89_g7098 [Cudoniella acicularis]|uniref:Phthalate transporter n=1 Tax=Cudoniella acicularis TaxID=354080 RepID=A0A8H4RL25_9HELO|nr:hypothetical protein G7Y89_g7098 [Cudoniella acicularis]